jgi:hypothetical protein
MFCCACVCRVCGALFRMRVDVCWWTDVKGVLIHSPPFRGRLVSGSACVCSGADGAVYVCVMLEVCSDKKGEVGRVASGG